jgi:hypothetical protein
MDLFAVCLLQDVVSRKFHRIKQFSSNDKVDA